METVDPTTKGNLLFFFGSILVLVALWLLILGATGSGPLRIALGVCALVAAVFVFRLYATTRR